MQQLPNNNKHSVENVPHFSWVCYLLKYAAQKRPKKTINNCSKINHSYRIIH